LFYETKPKLEVSYFAGQFFCQMYVKLFHFNIFLVWRVHLKIPVTASPPFENGGYLPSIYPPLRHWLLRLR